jgi:hypothetical protein
MLHRYPPSKPEGKHTHTHTLISLCQSKPSHQLPPWIFVPSLKRKLHLPLFLPTDKPFCPCQHYLDPFSNHIFQCKHICEISPHNSIRDGIANPLAPLLSSVDYLLPSSTLDIKLLLHLPSDPHAHPFDMSLIPVPATPPLINHACPYTTVGFDVSIACPPPCSPLIQLLPILQQY